MKQADFLSKILDNHSKIDEWLREHEQAGLLPFYTSVDIRHAGFKIAAVDTNLFPAGFNNISLTEVDQAVETLKETILRRVRHCKNILFITEEHTRNKFYLENVLVLKKMIEDAGFNVTLASFLSDDAEICKEKHTVTLETHSGKHINIHCLKYVLSEIGHDSKKYDLIILNNDLSTGIPERLQNSTLPIYPSLQAGWHSRLKSHHFNVANKLINEFSDLIDVDPWFFSCEFLTSDSIDINIENDRHTLHSIANDLFEKIEKKYTENNIKEKPFIFLKSDKGTYGMGVQPIENPDDILSLNRKQRNKLSVGKSSQVIERFILQEGVPTIGSIDNHPSEICIYQIANNFVGGFYRINNQKSDRENLNSQGMRFQTLSPSEHDETTKIYQVLARISGIAAQREVNELEEKASLQKHPS